MAMGRCYEALGKGDEALETYRQAAQVASTTSAAEASISVQAWQSAANVLVRSGRFDEAAAELNSALIAVGDRAELLANLVQVRIAQQARVPKDRQSWAQVERDLARGLKAFPATRP
jgi:tetratricopeptide (TPR) repeat protein